MSKPHLEEIKIVELSDEQLKELLGHTYEAIKTLEELKKNDERIEELQAELKTYVAESYTDDLKRYKARLKAARNQAKIRNLSYTLPGDMK